MLEGGVREPSGFWRVIVLSREEYERIIKSFLVELNHLCLDASEKDLRALPRLNPEIDGYLEGLRDPEDDAGQALCTAFAYVDDYVGADWDRVASAGYAAYRIGESKIVGGAGDA
jgi:hypothetical protein